MVNSFSPEYPPEYTRKRSKKNFKEENEDNTEDNKAFLDIWNVNPSFRDISNRLSIIKAFFLICITILMIISLYILYQDIFIAIIVGVVFTIFFIIIFHDEFFILQNIMVRNQISFNPFSDYVFWYDKNKPVTLFISNRKDLTHIAIRIFKVDIIPENVQSSIRQFVKALSSKNVRLSYSYQIVQKPVINLFNKTTVHENSIESINTAIHFSVFYKVTGVLTNYKIERLNYYINSFSRNFKSNLVANFHHFRITLLSDTNLVNAIRTFFIRDNPSVVNNKSDKKSSLNGKRYNGLGKLGIIGAFITYITYFLLSLKITIWYIIALNSLFTLLIIFIWWRSVFFQFTKNKLLKEDNISIASPFEKVNFFRVKRFPYSLFIHIDNQLLLGLKMVSLKYIYQKPFCLFGKFLEGLNNHKILFSYTLKNRPITYYDFYHNGLDHVYEKIQSFIQYGIKNQVEAEKWLGYRYGMWFSILTISINSYKFIRSINTDDFDVIEEDLNEKIDSLKGAFNLNFQNYEIENLKTNKLLAGYLFSSFKNNLFRLNGSHLNYLMLQGANLTPLTTIVDVLKKGTDTMIAAEFNTPLYLKNSITIGHTRNTEVLENEVPFGFAVDQLKSLLIVHGTSAKRDYASMKIIAELIEAKIPSLVFDLNGTWSKLISYFKGSQFEKEIEYFKLGKAFTIDPLISDIEYDTDNTGYLEYMFDAYGIAFKKDQRTIEMFRNIIRKNPDMDLSSMNLDLQSQRDYEKSPINDSLLSLFSDFSQQDFTFFQSVHGDTTNKIKAYDFVRNNKTVIIDLSILRDLDKQLFFIFLIISKIIHYIKNSENYYSKIIRIPNIDVFFNSRFLDMKMNYGKVNVYLDPLKQHGFGFLFSANQIYYLHPNLLTYLNNIITFKATDNRDISILKSLMNLQELEGTGYYTRSRNQTYQIKYVQSLRNNEIVVRRDDIYQPFPAIIDWDKIKNSDLLSYEDIVHFMEEQGYDLKYTEGKILEQAKQTIFEKDLSGYVIYLEEIIKFLDEIKSIDKVGNLYKQKLKKILKEIMYPKVSKKTNKKEQIKRIRDELFEILIKHGYLVEDHPKRASGSETLRTSYSVGDQYQKAVSDYFEHKERVFSDLNVEILERGSNSQRDLSEVFQQQPSRKYIIQKANLKNAFAREFSDFNYHIFKIYSFINKRDYENALRIEYEIIKNYLVNIYKQYYNIDTIVTSAELDKFLNFLSNIEDFPFSNQELIGFIEKYQVLDLRSEKKDSLAKEIYQVIYDFFIKIQNYIYGNDEKNGYP